MKMRWMLPLLLAAAVLVQPGPARAEVETLDVWDHLPVLNDGRVMPMDSYARHLLLGFSGKSTYQRQPASKWLARLLFNPEAARNDTIFLVDNPEVVEALGLSADGRGRYSFAQLEPALHELTRLARAAFHLEDEARSPVETELMRLYSNLSLYRQLSQGLDFTVARPDFDVTSADLRRDLELPEAGPLSLLDVRLRQDRINALLKMASTSVAPPDTYQEELRRLATANRMWSQQRGSLPPAMIPAGGGAEPWVGAWDALNFGANSEAVQGELQALNEMAAAFRAGQQVAFDIAARNFASSVTKRGAEPRQVRNLKREVQYNRADAFYRSELLYGLAFLVALLSVPFRGRWLHRAAGVLVVLALIPHTYGIIARMVIMGRPPVTNLYTTFIFVSWVCVVIGLVVEYLQRNRLGLITASSMGLALLMTSGRFGSDGDTMGVMVAVLDSNFWLATHVVTIAIGYAGCCAAGLLGHIYLLQALRRDPEDEALKETFNATYGALAFGLIFAFLGTMLGGIWADQSWGRFWGWDPKENGALVIVLWSSILFHARLGRMIGPLGFAAGCVLGVIGVLLAWMGVNLLAVGLHSYGFTSGIARGLALSCGFELLFVAVLVPLARRRAGVPLTK